MPNRSYSPIDIPLIRYADIVLSLAECLNEQGKTDLG
ncbi:MULTISPECIES: RagB/SusD family nutrient uptake outer membrane protein [Parabacteroides]